MIPPAHAGGTDLTMRRSLLTKPYAFAIFNVHDKLPAFPEQKTCPIKSTTESLQSQSPHSRRSRACSRSLRRPRQYLFNPPTRLKSRDNIVTGKSGCC